jgi:hypothetical protein
MNRPYGKRPKKDKDSSSRKSDSAAFKIRLRGKDGAPLSMTEMRQGLYDIARKLQRYEAYRAKWVTLYLTVVDEDGTEVRIDPAGEWTLFPYKSAADEHDA